ncbi:MAG: protein rep, partial [Waterburya sp.]
MSNAIGRDFPDHILPYETETKPDTNELCLQEVSQRDKPWDKHRGNSDRAANHYRGNKEFDRYATRMDFCSQLLDFRLVPEENEYKLKLDTAKFCRVRHCPVCQWRRSLMWKAKAFKILPMVVEAYSKHRWLFLTLTVRNCKTTELRDTLQWLNQSWQRMSQRKQFPAIG